MARGMKTGGRKPGSKNKRTLQIEAAGKEAMQAIEEALGDDAFKGDGVALLEAIYKSPKFPPEMRMEAASRAAKFERPALASVDNTISDQRDYVARLPQPMADAAEWLTAYGPQKNTKKVDPGVPPSSGQPLGSHGETDVGVADPIQAGAG